MDDTALSTDSAKRASRVLQTIEPNAVHRRLKLNRIKCEKVVMGEAGADIRLEIGTGLAQFQAAKHVGCDIYASRDVGKELGAGWGTQFAL